MSDDLSIPSSFDGRARLFPLPNVVLFPRVLLPLHIFEPRYRQLTADALATDRLLAMVLLQAGPDGEFEERPALHSTACLGKIVADQRLEDGRFYIFLRGLSRVRILNEISSGKPYRSAQVEPLHDTGWPSAEQARAYRQDLSQFATTWFSALGLASEPLAKLLQSDLSLSTLVDILGSALPLTIPFKQQLLQELGVEKRTRLLLQYLQTEDPPKKTATANKFPPEFSTN